MLAATYNNACLLVLWDLTCFGHQTYMLATVTGSGARCAWHHDVSQTNLSDVVQWSIALMVKARELTRDNVGVTAELSAVVDVDGHSHPCSVKAYFAVECVPSEVWCFCTIAVLSSRMEKMNSFTCFSFQFSYFLSVQFSAVHYVVRMQLTHDFDDDYIWLKRSFHRHFYVTSCSLCTMSLSPPELR